MLTPSNTPADEIVPESSFPKGNPSFVTQLGKAITCETHLLDGVKVTLEHAENCDATLAISSHGQTTYLQITEHGWKDMQDPNNPPLLYIVGYVSTAGDEKDIDWDIFDYLTLDYYYDIEDKVTKESNNRTVEISQESVVTLTKIAHFINQAIAIGLGEKNTGKSLKITKQSGMVKIPFSHVELQMPQGLVSETKKDFYSDKFLKNVSDYINDRVKTIQRRDQHEHQ